MHAKMHGDDNEHVCFFENVWIKLICAASYVHISVFVNVIALKFYS